MTDVRDSLEEYRGTRTALEAAVLPLATSVDGRRFTFQLSLHGLELEPGGYVAIHGDGSTRLGQVLSLELRHQDTAAPGVGGLVRIRAGGGEGVVLDGDERPFHDTALATEDAIRIAGEGRKFGLYLIVATQRPQKIHENVLSQCDNLVVMRMNSVADLAYVASVFPFVPPGLIDRATDFGQGEALTAGKIASHPALVRFGSRISHEGGADVAGWA